METTYEFSAYSRESTYGFGTEQEANQYLDLLSAEREVNLYQKAISELTDNQAEVLAFNLREALNCMALQAHA